MLAVFGCSEYYRLVRDDHVPNDGFFVVGQLVSGRSEGVDPTHTSTHDTLLGMLLSNSRLIGRRQNVKHAPIIAAVQIERLYAGRIARRASRATQEFTDVGNGQLGTLVRIEKDGHAGKGSVTACYFTVPRSVALGNP
jgi:hypothetical protein